MPTITNEDNPPMNSKLRETISLLESKFAIAMHKSIQDGDPKHRESVLDEAEKAIRQAVGEEMLELVTDWCQCEGGYITTGGMAMEDDLVEKWSCEDCPELRQKIKQWAAPKETSNEA